LIQKEATQKAMHHIALYLEFWTIYEEQLKLDIKAYKASLEQKKAGLKQLLVEVQSHRKDLDELDRWFGLISFSIAIMNLINYIKNFYNF